MSVRLTLSLLDDTSTMRRGSEARARESCDTAAPGFDLVSSDLLFTQASLMASAAGGVLVLCDQ